MGSLIDAYIMDLLGIIRIVGLNDMVRSPFEDGNPDWDYTVFDSAVELKITL